MNILSPDALPPLPAVVAAGRVRAWDMSDLTERVCPACSSNEQADICKRPDGLSVKLCMHCGMGFVSPAPSASQLSAFYARYADYKSARMVQSKTFRTFVAACRNPYIRILMKSGGLRGQSLLDYGCSRGEFVLQAQAMGAQVVGVDIDEVALEDLRRLGISAFSHVPKAIEFDVVTGLQVIEHLEKPLEWLLRMHEIMKHDSRLLLSVPNATEYCLIGSAWVGFRVDLEHINYFSIATMAGILRRAGFALENFWLSGQPNLHRVRGAGLNKNTLVYELSCRALQAAGLSVNVFDTGTFVLTVLARKI